MSIDENTPNMIILDKFRFSTSYSKYTSSKSTKQSGIRADGSLSISVDSLKLTNLQDRLEELKQFCDKTNQDIQGLDQQVCMWRKNIQLHVLLGML